MDSSPTLNFLLPTDAPWRVEGLFSHHFLTRRLPSPNSEHWAAEDESDAGYVSARARLHKNLAGLAKGNEEDCEDNLISPMLTLLGFGYAKRKAIPDAGTTLLPDYLLYASEKNADAAFHAGNRAAYYKECLGLLEAKKWGVNLSQETGSSAKRRSPHSQIRDYLTESENLAWAS